MWTVRKATVTYIALAALHHMHFVLTILHTISSVSGLVNEGCVRGCVAAVQACRVVVLTLIRVLLLQLPLLASLLLLSLLALLLPSQATPLLPELLRRALALVEACPCGYAKGCPRCVQHLDCKNYNAVLCKKAAVHVLKAAIEQEEAYSQRQQGEQG
jgi:hypothetical protein